MSIILSKQGRNRASHISSFCINNQLKSIQGKTISFYFYLCHQLQLRKKHTLMHMKQKAINHNLQCGFFTLQKVK